MHAASAGEFEQGKPVLEALRETYPDHKILVSFFSPSGFSVGQKYKGADIITYLPLDTAANAVRFVRIIQPKLVVFVKYDYWYHHLKTVADRKIPLLLISAIYRDNQAFFKWYGGFHRRMLPFFTQIFVQDHSSQKRLAAIGVNHCRVNGDTRFDRVASIIQAASKLDNIDSFIDNLQTVIAGSTWQEDEELFLKMERNFKLIIAPHEISKKNITRLIDSFQQVITYSELQNGIANPENYKVLIIDNIGMLSRLYQYATITYIGGGFNKSGIHNTLEAAAWGKPVVFGPNYQKFAEAKGLLQIEAAFTVSTFTQLEVTITKLLTDKKALETSSLAAKAYVQKNGGATAAIIQFIQEKRLLTT
ncbi:MAG: 3-deoxy-D-manno-octulosonic acid transferase [Flaviaesturariibacter sp.]|nr:3-deoxy-D-manno-octulosonic acid transferase [Flaviaesturariibacter sp.]